MSSIACMRRAPGSLGFSRPAPKQRSVVRLPKP
jgi:hypothetical protein